MGSIISADAVAAASATTWLSTELNSLAANTDSSASGTAYNNVPTSGSSTAGYFTAEVEVHAVFAAAISAGAVFQVFIVPELDGSTYADANSTSAQPIMAVPLGTGSTQDFIRFNIDIPPCNIKCFARHSASQSLASSGSTIKIRPARIQVN